MLCAETNQLSASQYLSTTLPAEVHQLRGEELAGAFVKRDGLVGQVLWHQPGIPARCGSLACFVCLRVLRLAVTPLAVCLPCHRFHVVSSLLCSCSCSSSLPCHQVGLLPSHGGVPGSTSRYHVAWADGQLQAFALKTLRKLLAPDAEQRTLADEQPGGATGWFSGWFQACSAAPRAETCCRADLGTTGESLVGKYIRKAWPGKGWFHGIMHSYDAKDRWCALLGSEHARLCVLGPRCDLAGVQVPVPLCGRRQGGPGGVDREGAAAAAHAEGADARAAVGGQLLMLATWHSGAGARLSTRLRLLVSVFESFEPCRKPLATGGAQKLIAAAELHHILSRERGYL